MYHDLRTVFTAIPMFENLDSDEINQLTKRVSVQQFKDGEPLLVEGAPSESLKVVLAGKVSVVKGTGESGNHICDLDAGEVIGEVGVLERAPCSANVLALGDVEAASISSEDLEAYFSSNRLAAIKILRQMVHVLAGRLRQTNVSYSSLKHIADNLD